MLQTIITFMLDKPIQVIATVATLIGGLAAVGYFWKKIIASWKQFREKRCNIQEKKMAKKNKIRYVLDDEPEGQVPLDSPFYVERPPIESDCYETIVKPAALIRIKAPRQMGKSSLMTRILHHAEQQGCHTVALNFQQADAPVFKDLDKFLQWFCTAIARKSKLSESKAAECWADFLGSKDNCTDYFQSCLLENTDKPLVLALDEVDRIFEHKNVAEDFFGLLRAWHEEGKHDEMWKRLRLVIVHSREVYIPLKIHESPAECERAYHYFH